MLHTVKKYCKQKQEPQFYLEWKKNSITIYFKNSCNLFKKLYFIKRSDYFHLSLIKRNKKRFSNMIANIF